jgi:hypothetical protein
MLYQEEICAASLKVDHIMDTAVKTVNITHASALNHHDVVGLLKETESEHNKVIYHTIMWLN